ncbi:hypothetical protein JAAARDRAFT_205976 [Jaapia argillacea MUCL 33604]|uniref:BTB domain-containing protein n=1 Tax=Jaapia argillacea MUCL 33604 TaxID=933084 RepID=A0A067PWB1_9AGAM|nr:hypothetical protein JAAARDRAFT_205976 [Jaapia argillacea MUCL 33604]
MQSKVLQALLFPSPKLRERQLFAAFGDRIPSPPSPQNDVAGPQNAVNLTVDLPRCSSSGSKVEIELANTQDSMPPQDEPTGAQSSSTSTADPVALFSDLGATPTPTPIHDSLPSPSPTRQDTPILVDQSDVIPSESLEGSRPASPVLHRHFSEGHNGRVFLLVEKTLFSLPPSIFQHSDYFKDIVAKLGPSSESDPFFLRDVKASEFRFFLGALFPLQFNPCEATTPAEWASVLDLATKLSCKSVCDAAIHKLATLVTSPVDKLILAREYGISKWLDEAYVTLCRRPEALSMEEAERLGTEDATLISQKREEVRLWPTLRDPRKIAATVRNSRRRSSRTRGGFDAIFLDEVDDWDPRFISPESEAPGVCASYTNLFALRHADTSSAPVNSGSHTMVPGPSMSRRRTSGVKQRRVVSAPQMTKKVVDSDPPCDPDKAFAYMGSEMTGYIPAGASRRLGRRFSEGV